MIEKVINDVQEAKMREITPDELKEPSVIYFIPDGTVLPPEIVGTLRHYIGERVMDRPSKMTGMKYEIPSYLMRDWMEKYG